MGWVFCGVVAAAGFLVLVVSTWQGMRQLEESASRGQRALVVPLLLAAVPIMLWYLVDAREGQVPLVASVGAFTVLLYSAGMMRPTPRAAPTVPPTAERAGR